MKSSVSAFLWKLMERFGYLGIQFLLQLILARILSPEHYGVLSLMMIFTTLANIFIQTGFNTALIQNKDVKDDDYSSVFWVSFGIAGVLYAIIFFASPWIASFYQMPEIVFPLRILALMLFPGAINSIQLAKVSRELDFKKVFVSNIISVVLSGGIGIAIAVLGGGIWSLVVQTLLQTTFACLIMFFCVRWYPRFVCNLKRVKVLFKFGWKLLVSLSLDTLYQDIYSIVIGKKYDSATLGYHNRGKQFPQFIISAVNGAVQSVMLPTMSAEQDDKTRIKELVRNSIVVSSYIVFPIMAGLAAVSTPLVKILLTDKWLPCVPYLQIYCISQAFYPVHSCNLQAINAMGRSDIFLRLEIIKKIYGVIALVIIVLCFDSPIAIAMTSVITTVIGCFVNAHPNKKLIGYSYFEQMKDILPSLLLSVSMYLVVMAIGFLPLTNNIILIILQVITGVAVYALMSAIFRPVPYRFLLDKAKAFIKAKKTNKA